MAANPTLEIALALIVRDRRVLVARRAHGALAGRWEFPGGKIEAGEDWEATARRECLEELGIAVGPCGRLGTVEYAYPEVNVRLNLVVCETGEGDAARPLASDAVAWATLDELGTWEIPEPNFEILKRLREHVASSPD